MNLDGKHTHGPNVSLAFEFKNDIWTSVYVECTKKESVIVSYGGSSFETYPGNLTFTPN